jgi:hypothetical protein
LSNYSVATIALDNIVAFDSIVAFLIPLVALLPVMCSEVHLWNVSVLQSVHLSNLVKHPVGMAPGPDLYGESAWDLCGSECDGTLPFSAPHY